MNKACKECVREADGNPLLIPTRSMVDKDGKPYPGPRCYSHHLKYTREKKRRAHQTRISRTYGNGWGDLYYELKEFQGGTCAICQVAKGISRNLSMDHDHKCCVGKVACGNCNRGLLCTRCNDLLGHARDDIQFFMRAAEYLANPPVKRFMEGKER